MIAITFKALVQPRAVVSSAGLSRSAHVYRLLNTEQHSSKYECKGIVTMQQQDHGVRAKSI
jgi:hypothetical protein